MNTLSYRTKFISPKEVAKKWWIVDAKNMVLGRLSSEVAKIVKGKYKSSFTPHIDCGDNVIIINAEHIKLTGNKWDKKIYISHTGYPGGQKQMSAKEVYNKDPRKILQKAIKNMLPKNKLSNKIMGNIRIYIGEDYIEQAQKPEVLKLKI